MHRSLVVLFLLGASVTTRGAAQQTSCPAAGDSASSMGGMGGMGMMMDHAMMARMDSADARLDSLTRLMAKSTGSRKINAMSAVVGALVAERLEMRRMMHEHMMEQMDMPGMSGPGGMMPMGGAGCAAPQKSDSTAKHDPQHQH